MEQNETLITKAGNLGNLGASENDHGRHGFHHDWIGVSVGADV